MCTITCYGVCTEHGFADFFDLMDAENAFCLFARFYNVFLSWSDIDEHMKKNDSYELSDLNLSLSRRTVTIKSCSR